MMIRLLLLLLLVGCTSDKSVIDKIEGNPFINKRADATFYDIEGDELGLEMVVFTESTDRVYFFYQCSGNPPYDYVGTDTPDEYGQARDVVAFVCPTTLIITARAVKGDKRYDMQWRLKLNEGN